METNTETAAAALAPSETADVRYLDPKTVRFERHGAALRLTIEDEVCYGRVTLVRLFPLSDPDVFLSVRDGANKEVGILTDLAGMDAPNRELAAAELGRRYVVPEVKRVVSVRERFGTVDWQVETDRGLRAFTTRNLRENITQPQPNRYLFADVDGNRYDVPDITALDTASQNTLMRFI